MGERGPSASEVSKRIRNCKNLCTPPVRLTRYDVAITKSSAKANVNRSYFQVCRFILFFIAASASFTGFYQKSHFCEAGLPGAYPPAQFEAMVDGTAHRPYVYRQMLPEIANLVDRIVPQSIKSRLYAHQGSGLNAYLQPLASSPTAQNKIYFFRYLVVYTLTFLFALVAVYAMSWVCRALDFCEPAAILAPVIFILLIPFTDSGGGNLYDFPELAFFALSCWIALKLDWGWIIPIAALGAWNKESFILFLLTLYPLIRRRNPQQASLLALAVLCAVYLSISLPIRMHFAHNPGSAIEFHLFDQLHFFSHPRTFIFSTEGTYGVRAPQTYSLLPLAMVIWTVHRAWKDLPRAIRQHAKIAAVINIPLYYLFCLPGELRDLSMLYITFLLVIAVNLNNWIRRSANSSANRLQSGTL